MFVFNGFSDWEPALAIAGLQQFTDVEVNTFSIDGLPVRSMGNVQVTPDLSIQDLPRDKIALLLLPGGSAWDESKNKEILPLITDLVNDEVPVAAICGATSFLAQHQFLDNRRHTSNHLEMYLRKMAPTYHGDQYYLKEHCVTDGNLITANGTATVQFASAIFDKLMVMDNEDLKFWFGFFTHPEMVTN
jgi:transcriptional regulator GlxA family with amidase domain